MLVSIVIPCYNSEKTIERVVDLCVEEFDKLEGYECEFVLVNDFSKDKTYEAICRAAAKYPCVKGINLAKNFGQHNAIMAGLNHAEGDMIIGMDDDLQTHPSQIPILLGKMEEGFDVVFGVYKKRKFGFFKNLVSKISGFITWHLVERPKGIEAGNYWVIRKYVRDEVIQYKSYNLYLSMLFFRTTGNVGNVEIEHFSREEGTSNYTFRKAFKVFMAFINFTVLPLRLATILGCLFSVCGLLGAVITIIQKLLDPTTVVGWSSLMCVMLVLFGFAFLMLGIIGEYVGKLILNVNRTPQYVIRETVNLSEQTADGSKAD
ncbi:MAG: glycosyltransferase family 2 protein [Oscillospiraceae bacterium]|nr:glycosyltransferase family 2 protein [Oscillospiraceae bacterium]